MLISASVLFCVWASHCGHTLPRQSVSTSFVTLFIVPLVLFVDLYSAVNSFADHLLLNCMICMCLRLG